MTLRTSLIIAGDASGGVKALDEATRALDGAAKEAAALSGAYTQADAAIDRLASAQTQANAQIAAARQALAQGKLTTAEYNREILETRSALALVQSEHRSSIGAVQKATAAYDGALQRGRQVTEMSGQQRAGMQQLSMQLNDVATMFALGAPPQQIFASQMGQVLQATTLLTGGTSKLATFLMGPWGMAITAATMILVPFIGKLFETKDAADTASDALQRLIDKRAQEVDQSSELTEANVQLDKMKLEAANLEKRIAAGRGTTANTRYQSNDDILAGARRERERLQELNLKILTAEDAIRAKRAEGAKEDTRSQQEMIAARAKLAGATTAVDRAQALYTIRIKEADEAFAKSNKTAADQEKLLQARTSAERALNQAQDAQRGQRGVQAEQRRLETLGRSAAATEEAIKGAYALADAYLESDSAALRAEATAKAREQAIRRQGDIELFVSQEIRQSLASRAVDAAKATAGMQEQAAALAHVNAAMLAGTMTAEQAEDYLRNEAQLRPIVAAQLAAEGVERDKLSALIVKMTSAQEKLRAEETSRQSLNRATQLREQQAGLSAEIELTKQLNAERLDAIRNSSGSDQQDQLDAIAVRRDKALVQIRAELEAEKLRTAGMAEAAAWVLRLADSEKELIDLEAKFNAEARAAGVLNDRVSALSGALGNVKGPVGSLIGVATANDPIGALLGMGGIGTLAGLMTSGGRDAYKKQSEEIVRGMEKIFGGDGKFAKTMGSLLQGAGTGAMVGSVVFAGSSSAQTGSTIGGSLGKAAFTEFASESLKKTLGAFGGPLGSIVGSMIGGVIGGLVASTPRGSATFNESGLVSTRGNSRDRISGATSLGGDALDAFDQLLDKLGATASGISFSAGIRKNNFVLDPSGQGRTKGAGTINFGKDQEAFLKAVLSEMFSDASFEGLSDGFQRLLKNGGDIEKQIQKVLTLKGAQDDLAQRKDGQAFDLAALDKEFGKLRDIANEAGEGLAEVEELFGLRRQEIVDKYAQEALDKERSAKELQVQILTLEGKQTEAVALARELEVEGLSDSEKALKARIFALQDEADKAAATAAIAEERTALEARLLQAQGDTLALQARELAAVDASNRSILEQIFALENQKAATAAAAQEAEDAAAKAKAIADERYDLETQLLQIQGDTVALRQRELDTVDPVNRALKELILVRSEEAAAAKAIADERYSLETRLLQAQGDTLALQARELETVDPANRSLLERIFAIENEAKQSEAATAAIQAHAQAMDDARGVLSAAYERESGALKDTIDTMRGFEASIRDFRMSLTGSDDLSIGYDQALAKYRSTANMAALGDEKALGAFASDAQAFLTASRANSANMEAYQRDLAMVIGGSLSAENGADGLANAAERQQAALDKSVEGLIELKEETVSVREALDRLNALQTDQMIPAIVNTTQTGFETVAAELATSRAATTSAASDQRSAIEQMAMKIADLTAMFRQCTRPGGVLAMQLDGGDTMPVEIQGTPTVLVGNSAAAPVQVHSV